MVLQQNLLDQIKNIYISEFDEQTFKQKRKTAIGTKFGPPYAIFFMADFEEKKLEILEKKAMISWR